MLSAQRKEFDEKKKDESPYPRDFSRWYALDYFRRPRGLRASRFYITLVTTLLVTLLCLASLVPAFHHTHQAGPVAKAHALFNQNCAACHDQMFGPLERLVQHTVSVSDQRCNECHHGAPHNLKLEKEPACASCHREHQGHEILASHVADRQCAACHANLAGQLKANQKTSFQSMITEFPHDHPEFQPSRAGKKDEAKIKFNHKAHLDLHLEDLRQANAKLGLDDFKSLGAKMECASCHQLDNARQYFLPIKYENHCAGCHQLNVALAGQFAKELGPAVTAFSKTPLPHKEPVVVRAVLRDRLIEFAQKNAVVSGPTEPNATARPLPWKPTPVNDAQWSWANKQGQQAEELLFMNKQWSKNEKLTTCSHCHIEKPGDRPQGLPVFHATNIPARWYKHSVFNHGSHRLLNCVACHDSNAAAMPVGLSQSTADILLPTKQVCQECHHGSANTASAGNACILCHRYHDRLLERSPDGPLRLADILGK